VSNHIGDINKMVSDTPISDSTPHNVADLAMLCRRLERLAAVRLAYIKQLESNNDAANAEIERLTNKVAQLYRGAEEQNQRIKRLEEAGDAMVNEGWNEPHLANAWRKAKEAKP
jgi:peptidoglycan hydrolase CwlO-like protein